MIAIVPINLNCTGCGTPLSATETQTKFLAKGYEVRICCLETDCDIEHLLTSGGVKLAYRLSGIEAEE